ncbi:MAG: signal peptidase II [Candidatus Coproplasma sp.]
MSIKKFKPQFGKISIITIAVFAVLLAADLVLKWCEEEFLWNFTVIPKLITVESGVRNPGAAFSFLASAEWGQTFLIIITVIMLVLLIGCFVVLPERFVLLKLALAMVVSGAVGNLVDRIAFGNVRDFVWVNMFGNWACCNFADFWIVFGVIIAAVDLLFLNEWAVFPLTKRAKAAQSARKTAEEQKAEGAQSENTQADGEEE